MWLEIFIRLPLCWQKNCSYKKLPHHSPACMWVASTVRCGRQPFTNLTAAATTTHLVLVELFRVFFLSLVSPSLQIEPFSASCQSITRHFTLRMKLSGWKWPNLICKDKEFQMRWTWTWIFHSICVASFLLQQIRLPFKDDCNSLNPFPPIAQS